MPTVKPKAALKSDKSRKPPAVQVDDLPPVVAPVEPVVAPTTATKPQWGNRILYAVVVGYVIWSMTHRKPVPVPEPQPVPVSSLVAEIAPLFPPDQNEAASLYAAYFTAQADKAAKDGKPVSQAVFKRARESMGLADNLGLGVVVTRVFAPFTLLKGDWPPEQLDAYVKTQRELADACLAASLD